VRLLVLIGKLIGFASASSSALRNLSFKRRIMFCKRMISSSYRAHGFSSLSGFLAPSFATLAKSSSYNLLISAAFFASLFAFLAASAALAAAALDFFSRALYFAWRAASYEVRSFTCLASLDDSAAAAFASAADFFTKASYFFLASAARSLSALSSASSSFLSMVSCSARFLPSLAFFFTRASYFAYQLAAFFASLAALV